ncbi:hypothetical protein N0V91_007626 [Didymella pomorum]|uniref:Uncharacterized protein n=1 Tax=Didymella pomorum TaxID=749634 RepID=A0A9W8Z8P9_9PLEO|nr:hypothetical protein N0V91_007626 [Didymella pomorum]
MTRICIPHVVRHLHLETRQCDRKLDMPGESIDWNPSLRPFDPTTPACIDRHSVGSAIVAGTDGKPLCRTYLSAVVDYAMELKLKVTGVNVDVPSPYEVESKESLKLAVAIGAAGV